MKTLLLIGIGTGSPDHVTRAGIAQMRSADCVLLPSKGDEKADLAQLRSDLLAELAPDVPVVTFVMPQRAKTGDYLSNVQDWHDAIADAWSAAIPKSAERVALLVWGDPSLYDSTLRIAERLQPMPEIQVTPGITALQALTAAHAIPLNDLGEPVLITTGRKLRDEGWPKGVARLAVMLDGECSFQALSEPNVTIWWGAYLGMPNEVLLYGPLSDIGADIVATRAKARAAHGWIMDTYLLAKEK